uniref:Uncharacterized protein n=1 Tax=Erythrocystis saccata TaxID=2822695 RepID=A0A8E6NY01_9FLOR|nr:hypothetical protein [Erythrocystis saccata]
MLYYVSLKSVVPLIYLLLLPYKYLKSIVFIFIFILLNENSKIFFYKILKSLRNHIIFISYTILSILYTNSNYLNIDKTLKKNLLFPYFITNASQEKFICILKIYYIQFMMPTYIIKTIVINVLNIIITNNLFLITKSEILLNCLEILVNQKLKMRKKDYKLLLLNFLTSYEIIEKVLIKIYNLHLGIKAKNHLSSNNFIKYINYITQNITRQLIEESYITTLVLWNRN